MTAQGDDKSLTARDIVGSQVITGDNNTATMKNVTVTRPPPESVDIKAELAALRALLAALQAPDQGKLDRAMADAEEEVEKADPDRDEVGEALERAVKYAKGANSFAENIEKLAPRLAAVASWLGSSGSRLLEMAGMSL